MTWAARRQKLIIAILILMAAAFTAVVIIAVTYKAPSCLDNKQNQGESGIDCGGPCSTLCTANVAAPRALFVRAVSPSFGRTDVIAYVSNENPDAIARYVRYTLELYDSHEQLVTRREGTLTLNPGGTTPLYISNAYYGKAVVSQAFLTFDSAAIKWQRSNLKTILPLPSNIQITTTPTPKVTATITNPTANTIFNETLIATVFDASENAIGASQTVIPTLSGQGAASVVFTWNQAFPTAPVRVEILPVPST